MELNQVTNRIHPLVAGAAVSVTLVSLLGAAAIAGILPTSHGSVAPAAEAAPAASTAPLLSSSLPSAAQAAVAPATYPVAAAPAPVQYVLVQPVQAAAPRPIHHHPVVNHVHTVAYAEPERMPQYAQSTQVAPSGQYRTEPVYQPQPAPVAQHNSPVGIGVGALIGGALGSQVGGGHGRTLATIAGAVAGGYFGNEVAKRN